MKKKLILGIVNFIIAISPIMAQVPKCPIIINGTTLYDKNSFFADEICPILKNLDKIADGLGNSVTHVVNQVKKDVDAFGKVTLNDAIDEDAIVAYRNGVQSIQNIKKDLKQMLLDVECGVPGAMKALENKIKQFGTDVLQLIDIAKRFGQTAVKLTPVITETISITANVASITASIATETPTIKKNIIAIKDAVESITKSMKSISDLNPATLVTSTTALVTGLVPYIGSCSSCAGTIATAISGIGEAAGGTGGGAAASETVVGALVGAAVTAIGSLQSIIATVASSLPCQAMAAQTAELGANINNIVSFVNTVSSLISSISDNVDKIVEASNALIELGKTLGKENESKCIAVKNSFVNIAKIFGETANSFKTDIAPMLNNFAEQKLTAFTNDVKQLKRCYDKITDEMGDVAKEAFEGGKNLLEASVTMVKVDKVIDNLKNQFEEAADAAGNAATKQWNKLNKNRDDLIRTVLGDKPTDFGAVALHLPTLVGSIGDIFTKAKNLAENVIDLVTESIKAGKEGFLNQINTNTTIAKDHYKLIKRNSKKYMMDIAMAKIKAETRAKVKAASERNNAQKNGTPVLKVAVDVNTAFLQVGKLKTIQ
jgi:methyl-accepting chemotaxis protein